MRASVAYYRKSKTDIRYHKYQQGYFNVNVYNYLKSKFQIGFQIEYQAWMLMQFL